MPLLQKESPSFRAERTSIATGTGLRGIASANCLWFCAWTRRTGTSSGLLDTSRTSGAGCPDLPALAHPYRYSANLRLQTYHSVGLKRETPSTTTPVGLPPERQYDHHDMLIVLRRSEGRILRRPIIGTNSLQRLIRVDFCSSETMPIPSICGCRCTMAIGGNPGCGGS